MCRQPCYEFKAVAWAHPDTSQTLLQYPGPAWEHGETLCRRSGTTAWRGGELGEEKRWGEMEFELFADSMVASARGCACPCPTMP